MRVSSAGDFASVAIESQESSAARMTRVNAWEPAANDAGGPADAGSWEVSAALFTGFAIASGGVADDSRLADDAESGAGVTDEPDAAAAPAATDEVWLTDSFCDVGCGRATLEPRLR